MNKKDNSNDKVIVGEANDLIDELETSAIIEECGNTQESIEYNNNALAQEFNFLKLIKFALPTTIMMMFMSLYTMVDGIFISQYVGTVALAASNIAFPCMSILLGLGLMFGAGGSAVVAFKLGEGKDEEARSSFTFIILVAIVIGIFYNILGLTFVDSIVDMLGAKGDTHEHAKQYATYIFYFAPLTMLQMCFLSFFVTAGKPQFGLISTVTGGILNIVLDYIFIVEMDMGLVGASLGTALGGCVPAITGLIYFSVARKGSLYFIKPSLDFKAITKTMSNGVSEMISQLSGATTMFLFNIILMDIAGETGVASISIILYLQFLFNGIYLGYSQGLAPIISYKYGSGNYEQLQKILKISVRFIITSSIIVYGVALMFREPLISIFAKNDPEVSAMAYSGYAIYGLAILFSGSNLFSSSMFTALSNGKVSAIISSLRSFVFIAMYISILPQIFGINGVWSAVPCAEITALCVSIAFIIKLKDVYHYA